MSLEEFVNGLSKTVEKIIEKSGSDITPIVFAEMDNIILHIPVISLGENPREAVKATIEALRKMEVNWIVQVLPINFKKFRKEKLEETGSGVLIIGVARDGTKFTKFYEVVKVEEGYEIECTELKNFTGYLVPEPW